ncbi:NAC domain-containing protein 83-like [Andrographis paniculata]|uniref:NAC domain-containing protein 83-like n=1 Tax=Andrographis paniculata TaxID=175694 RepID=UPI0021E974E2|nr:NAC domain-containing protein 83-like [Andrographis paniculata]
MEKINNCQNTILGLPPGFRFQPTDEELVLQYLRRKVFNHPMPVSVIAEADVCRVDPWNLPGDAEEERYFFSQKRVKYPNGSRSNRATVSGYWKATGVDRRIYYQGRVLVGMKKTLVFYRGKAPAGERTDWIMHEYSLVIPAHIAAQARNWVLCRIFLKRNGNRQSEAPGGVVVDGGADAPPPLPATEVAVEPPPPARVPSPVFYEFLGPRRLDLNVAAPAESMSEWSDMTEEAETEDCADSGTCKSDEEGCQ